MTSRDLQSKRIGVLLGGSSAEREISLRTGTAILKALESLGYSVIAVDTGSEFISDLKQIDVAVVALHGRHGEDGTIQGLLEMLQVPYTGSGVLASSLAMDKVMTKRMLQQASIPTPEYDVFHQGEDAEAFVSSQTNFPLVVKPSREGSTIGISIVDGPGALAKGLDEAVALDRTVLVESFFAGDELTVGVLDGEALPVIQIVPQSGFYDYEAKYTKGKTEYLLPAPISQELTHQLQQAAVLACRTLGCRGGARVDFLANDKGWTCLEVNTIPGMTSTSLLPKAAAEAGISFERLCERLLFDAGLDK